MKVKPWSLAALVFCLAFSMFGGTAFGAPARYAVVTEVVGNAVVTKAGGALEIPVFTGMTLNEGDRLKVGKGGSLTLKIADSEDEIVLGENWQGTLSKLRENDEGGTVTAIQTWAGSMYSHVQKLAGTDSTFKVETPTAKANVRGTHFIVTIDRFTGEVKIVVNAGIVNAGSDSPDDPGIPVLPSQQTSIYPWMNNWADLDYIDPEDLTVSVYAEVITKMLKNKALIDEENDELLNNLEEFDEENGLNLLEEEILARYKTNVENSLIHILRAAVQAGRLDEVTLQDIIETVNKTIEREERKYDLENEVPPIDRSAGVNPEEEERRRQQREEAQKNLQERQQQKEQMRQDVNPELRNRMQRQIEEQRQANEQAQEELEQKTVERAMEQMSEEERKALKEKIQQKKEQQQQQQRERDPSDTPASPPAPNPGPPDDPIATSTSIELSGNSIVYGQTFTITAEVKTSNAEAVPDGGTVEFKIDETVIGSGTIADGKATLTVDKEKWASPELSGVRIGNHKVSASYAGVAQQYSSSASAEIDLAVAKADTTVELSITPDPPKPGDILEIRVNVAAKTPGGGEPTGTVTLYRLLNDDWQPVGEPIPLEPGMQSVTYEETFLRDTGAGEMQYKAEFVSGDGKHNNGVSEVKEVVVQPTEPIVLVKKVAGETPNDFEIQIDLANFTEANAVYGAELHFRHNLDIYEDLQDFSGKYNENKFGSGHDDEHSFRMIEKYDENIGRQYWPIVYEFSPGSQDAGVEFAALENMAKIVFVLSPNKTMDDVTVELMYWRFVDKNGNPIAVNIHPEAGIIINPVNLFE
jgi:hypothetical protein